MITLTELAVKEVKRIIEEMNNEQTFIRIGIKGGGCSGYQFSLALDTSFDEKKDTLHEVEGIKVVIDNRSALYLPGTVVDYHTDLNKRGFVLNNPSIKSRCGCGSSFNM